jgi:hypothetical protein
VPAVDSLMRIVLVRAAEAASPQDAPPRFVPAVFFVGIMHHIWVVDKT